MNIKCAYCDKEFEPSKYQLRQLKVNKPIYCSTVCSTKARYNKSEITDEIINRVKNLMNNTNMTYTEIQKSVNVSQSTFKELLEKYNLGRSKEQNDRIRIDKSKETVINKYGVTNIMFVDEIKNKAVTKSREAYKNSKNEIVDKIKQTKLEKYGDATYNNFNKSKQTMLDKYGVDCGYKTSKSINKRIATSLDKYGVDNPLKSKSVRDKALDIIQEKYGTDKILSVKKIRDKIEQTNIKRYGFKNAMSAKKISDKHKQTMLDKYNVTTGFLTDNGINSHKFGTISKINIQFKNKLQAILPNSIIKNEKAFGKYCYDIVIDDKLLIDINPSISHNVIYSYPYLTGMKAVNKPIDKDYHFNRYMNAKDNGYELISIFDWMEEDKIIDIICAKLKKLNNRIFANRCIIKEISQTEANKFLDTYHIQGAAYNQSVCIGLFFNNELVQVQTFGKPRFRNNVEWEAIRLANKFDTYIIGGVSKGFNYFVKKYNPKSVISYNSLNISSGNTDYLQNFKFQGYSKSQGMWVNLKHNNNPKFIHDRALRTQGIDRLLNKAKEDFPDYDGTYETSNEFLMIREGYVKVYDCGQITYVWTKENL